MAKYEQIVEKIFEEKYHPGLLRVSFTREELVRVTEELGFARVKNLGDIPHIRPIKVPDATPEIVRHYAPGTDEQALLARARYNRLVDIFTGITCYSIQNHLRTTVSGIGQVEVDEIYVGINKRGAHFVIPCQAKSPGDRFGIVQVMQDIALCEERYPLAICKPIALQFMSDNSVAILELTVIDEDELLMLNIVEEKHYELVARDQISDDELRSLIDGEP